MSGRPRFRTVSTTADGGLLVWGDDLSALYSNAALGLSRMMAFPSGIREREKRTVQVKGEDREALLVSWLEEWIFLFDTEAFLGCNFKATLSGKNCLEGVGWGEVYSPDRHQLRDAVKAVTYHRLYVRQSAGRWRAQVIFDL